MELGGLAAKRSRLNAGRVLRGTVWAVARKGLQPGKKLSGRRQAVCAHAADVRLHADCDLRQPEPHRRAVSEMRQRRHCLEGAAQHCGHAKLHFRGAMASTVLAAGGGRLTFWRRALWLRPWGAVRSASLEAVEGGLAGGERAALLSGSSRSDSPTRIAEPAHNADSPMGPAGEPKPTISQRTRAFFREYGKVGLGVYMCISTVSLATIYSAVRLGVDVPALLERVGVARGRLWDTAGTFALAYGVHKLFLPVRLLLTVSLTRAIHRRLYPKL